ncbi:MAG: cobalamin biosynthesis protein CobW, partial [Oscillospiraceae bacterium]|nr:cobalamin biosynthesis protein CobW [Oscillospiraceae bacterium]
QDAGIEITEMNSGCICCSLVGDFGEALKKVLAEFSPERIIIEPSGVGKLSDIIKAVQNIGSTDIVLNAFTTVVDAGKCKMYMKNFGEFFNDQVEHAGTIIMSHADVVSDEKLKEAVELVKGKNPSAVIVTTPISKLEGKALLEAIERKDTLSAALEHLLDEHNDDKHEHHHHHHDDNDEECSCGCHGDHEHHHHHDDEDEECSCGCHGEHEHHHHHDDEDEECSCGCHGDHEHHHHHDDEDEECSCGCHGHHHHHHHDADEVFVSWGKETTKKYSAEELDNILDELCDESRFGYILRAKGIVEGVNGEWIHFDYIPGENNIRTGSAGVIGRICVIGSQIKEEKIAELFN